METENNNNIEKIKSLFGSLEDSMAKMNKIFEEAILRHE